MPTWMQLNPEQAMKSWRMPQHIAADERNAFFAYKKLPYSDSDFDGPWSLIGFLAHPEKDGLVSFQITTLGYELLETMGVGENPLDIENYLTLTDQELYDTEQLLISKASSLQSYSGAETLHFVEIPLTDWSKWRIDYATGDAAMRIYYRQLYHAVKDTPEIETFLLLSGSKSRYFFQIMEFNPSEFSQPSYNPSDYGRGRITLDQLGMKNLAAIMTSFRRIAT